MNEKKNIIGMGHDEYWAEVYECPYCNEDNMLSYMNFCPNCGKSLKDFNFIPSAKYKDKG